MKTSPDMDKVRAAVAALEASRRARSPAFRKLPLPPSPAAHDSAIRKPLRAHGNPCSGFHHPNFLNRD